MAMDMGGPGIPGFGYGNQAPQANDDQRQPPAASPESAPEIKAEPAPAAPQGGNGAGQHQASNGDAAGEPQNEAHLDHVEVGEEIALDFTDAEMVPGFEVSASDCLNRALKIARSLNHTSLSSDHLMLALTMDPNARRLL